MLERKENMSELSQLMVDF